MSNPEAAGMDSSILDGLDHYIKQKRYTLVNSVLVIKNGSIVFEKYYNSYTENSRNPIKSLWKSILSILTGICLDRGIILSLDEPIGNYLHDFKGNNHPYHKLITIRHLLTMSSGIYWDGGVHYHCPMMDQMMRTNNWTSYLADIAMERVPGMNFHYKEWDIMLLSAVLGKAYGGTSYDIAQKYLYEPLSITSGIWPQSPCGLSYSVMKGEEETNLSSRDLAKIGLLFLDNGLYKGERIISADYVNQAVKRAFHHTSIGSTSSSEDSYGYLWWIYPDGYGGRGSGGQDLTIIPYCNYISVIQATPTTSAKSYGDIVQNVLKKAIL